MSALTGQVVVGQLWGAETLAFLCIACSGICSHCCDVHIECCTASMLRASVACGVMHVCSLRVKVSVPVVVIVQGKQVKQELTFVQSTPARSVHISHMR